MALPPCGRRRFAPTDIFPMRQTLFEAIIPCAKHPICKKWRCRRAAGGVLRRQTFFQCFKLCLKLSYHKSRLTKMEKKGEIHTKGKRHCYADFWISITQSMSKNYRKHNFTLIYSLTTQVKHGILSLQPIWKKVGALMTQPEDASAKEFDALFRSLEERYQMGELAILRALASIDSNDPDPPKKTSA